MDIKQQVLDEIDERRIEESRCVECEKLKKRESKDKCPQHQKRVLISQDRFNRAIEKMSLILKQRRKE